VVSTGDGEKKNGDSEDFARLLESYTDAVGDSIRVGDRIEGRVISIGKEGVFVDTGTKTDGVVDREEFLDEKGELTCKEGEVLELFVSSFDGNELKLSRSLSGGPGLRALREAFENSIPLEGKVRAETKGGFHVEIMGKKAFCPMSQIDLAASKNPPDYLGKTFPFLITRFEERGSNVVLSRVELLKKERQKSIQAFLEELGVGNEIEGKVTKVMTYGAFVELVPGVEGLVHVSQVSWSRLESPSQALSPGDRVRVKVIGIEERDGKDVPKISLSIKQVEADPWQGLKGKLREGEKLAGKVTHCTRYGAFVELFPGVEGLVHVSEMSYKKRVLRPEEVVSPGQVVPVMVKEIDFENKRISLSIKEAEGDPWIGVTEGYKVGQSLEGKLERKEKFGFFVELEPGVTGLLPVSKIKSSLNSAVVEKLKPGDRIPVIVEHVNPEERRISLAPADSTEETEWRTYIKEQRKQTGTFGEKLKEALKLREGR